MERGNLVEKEAKRGECVRLQGEVGDYNVARSVLPDATVTSALVGSLLSILRTRHTADPCFLAFLTGSALHTIPHCEGLY